MAPIRAETAFAGFKSSVQPILATGKVRHVGELVALCAVSSARDLTCRSRSSVEGKVVDGFRVDHKNR